MAAATKLERRWMHRRLPSGEIESVIFEEGEQHSEEWVHLVGQLPDASEPEAEGDDSEGNDEQPAPRKRGRPKKTD